MTMAKEQMIKEIVLLTKSLGIKYDANMFFSLAFCSENELIKIGSSLGLTLN
jgi:hypothetical protein